MKTNLPRILLGFTLTLLVCIPLASAQTVTGSITGQVTDPSSAVVPGARVVAHNLDTGVATSATTNSTGLYRIEFLPIGQYEATVEANGFDKAAIPPFTLEVLQAATFNVQLHVGSASTTVDVSAAAPILNTDNPTLGTSFTANTIENLPLNGLDFSALTLYLPGSVNTAGTAGMASIERNTYFTDTPNVNGNRNQSNNYTLDGIDMNEPYNNLIGYSPAPEALEEIRVITADSPTDYGNVNGAGVVNVLKSGTNHFHGSAYGYVQDYRMNANSWTNKHHIPSEIIPINPFSQAQFGGTLGGPILHNKLFFFADYLGSRYHTGGLGSASVMTEAMRAGDFSVLGQQLYDPLNNFAPFPGNNVGPPVNPVAKFLIANPQYYPLPNATPTDGIVNNNYQAHQRSYKANDQGDAKIEYDLSAKDKITGFFSKSRAYDGSTPVLAISFPGVNLFPTWIVGSNWAHTFSPSLINSARIGFSRVQWSEGLPQDPTGAFGISGDSKVGITFPNQAYSGFTFQSINGGLSGVGTPALNGGSLIDNTYSYIDNVTWQHGLHFVSMGIQALRYQNNYPTSNNNGYLGSMIYTGAFTGPSGGIGYGGADFLLDRVQTVQATLASVNVGQRQWRTAGFVNDDYKILPPLTLNIGVRYEFDEPWVEVNNKTGTVDLKTGQILYAHAIPSGASPGAGLCNNRACYQPNFRQIMPHVGFAYQLNDRTVIRGGYGASSFFEGNSSNQRLTSITPFIQAINAQVLSPEVGAITTPRTAEQGFTGGTTQYGGTYNVYPQNIQPAYVQEWNLTMEYALTRKTSLQAGYLGEKGDHIEDYGNVNQYLVNGDPTTALYYNNQYIGANAPMAVSVGSSPLLITESRAMMNYNALQAVLRQRQSHGLEFTLNYTYGRAMTNAVGNYGLNTAGYGGGFQNYYDSGADYGPAGFDVRHNVSATGVYALPLGHGQEYLANANRGIEWLAGGWKVSTGLVGYSGFPDTPVGPGNNSSSYGNSRPNQYRRIKIVNRSIDHWFGTDPSATPCLGPDNGVCAFGTPAANGTGGTFFGTASPGSLRGPGFLNADMSAFKDFRIIGEHTLGFRFDAFNAFNIASYGNPDNNISDVDSGGNTFFGNVSNQGTRSNSRTLQFSARYHF